RPVRIAGQCPGRQSGPGRRPVRGVLTVAVPTADTGPVQPAPGRSERRPRYGSKGAPPRASGGGPGSVPPGAGAGTAPAKPGTQSGSTPTPSAPSTAPGYIPHSGDARPTGSAPMGGADLG